MNKLCCSWCARAVSASREGHWTGWATEVGPGRWMCRVCRRRGSLAIPAIETGLTVAAFNATFKAIGVRVVPVQGVECLVAWIRNLNLLVVDAEVTADERCRIIEDYVPHILAHRDEGVDQ